MRLAVIPLVLAFVFSGCLSSPSPNEERTIDSALAMEPAVSAIRLEARGCVEGGGHSVHPEIPGYLPDPWKPHDVFEDVGPQVMYSELPYNPDYPVPTKGHTMGNYHATLVCSSWALDGTPRAMLFGFVAMRVQPPPFDDGRAERHYLTTVIATNDPTFYDLLHEAGFHATTTTGLAAFQGDLFHNVLDTRDHGVYESYFRPKEVGATHGGISRLWFQLENRDGTFSPIALDMDSTVGRHIIADGQGTFTHLRTEDHWPVPGAVGHTAGLAWTGFDRVITLGPRPDVKLAEAYVHL